MPRVVSTREFAGQRANKQGTSDAMRYHGAGFPTGPKVGPQTYRPLKGRPLVKENDRSYDLVQDTRVHDPERPHSFYNKDVPIRDNDSRPHYIDPVFCPLPHQKIQYHLDTGGKKGVVTAAKTNGQKYSQAFNSGQTRLGHVKTTNPEALLYHGAGSPTIETVGPGAYLEDRAGVQISSYGTHVKQPERESFAFNNSDKHGGTTVVLALGGNLGTLQPRHFFAQTNGEHPQHGQRTLRGKKGTADILLPSEFPEGARGERELGLGGSGSGSAGRASRVALSSTSSLRRTKGLAGSSRGKGCGGATGRGRGGGGGGRSSEGPADDMCTDSGGEDEESLFQSSGLRARAKRGPEAVDACVKSTPGRMFLHGSNDRDRLRELDAGPKQSLLTAVQASRQGYGGVFKSTVPRFGMLNSGAYEKAVNPDNVGPSTYYDDGLRTTSSDSYYGKSNPSSLTVARPATASPAFSNSEDRCASDPSHTHLQVAIVLLRELILPVCFCQAKGERQELRGAGGGLPLLGAKLEHVQLREGVRGRRHFGGPQGAGSRARGHAGGGDGQQAAGQPAGDGDDDGPQQLHVPPERAAAGHVQVACSWLYIPAARWDVGSAKWR
jgi:hypothetical protein